ncbi:MAG TPA: hypothetical protein VLH40_06825 [Atribacteraceae bacterium]|nr:hypothetical protein [Atribacteraceae bacterium]
MKIKIGIVLTIVTVLFLVSWYVLSAGEEKTTVALSGVLPITIEELMENSVEYEGKEVGISGTIVTQCSRGCKFTVNDDTGVLFVQMIEEAWEKPLPPSVGKTVELRGVFQLNPRPHINVLEAEKVRVR